MSCGTWLMPLLASVVGGDEELASRLVPLWQRITQLVGLFFGREVSPAAALACERALNGGAA